MVPRAGEAVGEDTLCLQHDPCIFAKRGLGELDVEIHGIGLFHLSTLRTKDGTTKRSLNQQAFDNQQVCNKQLKWLISPPAARKSSVPPPTDVYEALTATHQALC